MKVLKFADESNKGIINTDTEKTASDSDPDFQEPSKQEKYQFNSSMLDDQSDMPFRFCHNQNGIQSVMPEYYKLTDKIKTELYLSEVQAQGAIISVTNILFGRQEFGEWKIYEKGKEEDYNTLPAPKKYE